MKHPLRIFSLNTEYGKYSKTFIPYIDMISKDIDVFCFQEVPNNAKDTTCFEEGYDPVFYENLQTILSDFIGYYCEYVKESFGIAIFVRKQLHQKYISEEYIFWNTDVPFLDKKRWNNSTKALCVRVEWINIVTLHGAWQPKSKKQDTPERLIQSKILRSFTKWEEKKTLLIWDFNLMPETKSMKILEKKYINLIAKYNIVCTRTTAYDDPSLPFADYALIWEDIVVDDFSVWLEPIFSDHWFLMVSISRK